MLIVPFSIKRDRLNSLIMLIDDLILFSYFEDLLQFFMEKVVPYKSKVQFIIPHCFTAYTNY